MKAGTSVTFSYNVASGPSCPGQVSTACQLELSGNVCDVDNSQLDFSATKSGGDITVSVKDDARCSLELRCATDNCKNTNDWTGQYDVSGSKGVVVSVACLLTAVLSGMLL